MQKNHLSFCFAFWFAYLRKKKLFRNVLNGWTQHLEFSFFVWKVQGRSVSQNDSLDSLKVNPKMSIFTKQFKYYFKWRFLHWKCPGKTSDPNSQFWEPVIVKSYFLIMYDLCMYQFCQVLFPAWCPKLVLTWAYSAMYKNALGSFSGITKEESLRNTSAGQPCRYLMSLETKCTAAMMKTSSQQRLATRPLQYAF